MIVYFRKTQYVPVEERHHAPEIGAYRSFGIMAVRRTAQRYERMAYVRNISTDRAFVAGLAERCNRGGLSPVHLQDFIADVLGS